MRAARAILKTRRRPPPDSCRGGTRRPRVSRPYRASCRFPFLLERAANVGWYTPGLGGHCRRIQGLSGKTAPLPFLLERAAGPRSTIFIIYYFFFILCKPRPFRENENPITTVYYSPPRIQVPGCE